MPLRAARPDEAPLLTGLATAAKRHWGYPEAWLAHWRDALTITPAYIRDHAVVVADDGGQVLGFSALVLTPTFATLDHLWVRPEAMGRGFGRELFAHAEAAARRAGASCLRVTADPHAEGFYRKMGLTTVGHEAAPMGDTKRELPLMEKALA